MELLITAVLAICSMAVAFFLSLKLDFFSLVDAAWSYSFALTAAILFFLNPLLDSRLAFFAMIIIWSLRLGWHLTRRLWSHYPTEDSRYVALKNKWKEHLVAHFSLFFLLQGATIFILSLPIVLVSTSSYSPFGLWSFACASLWLVGICGEALADKQLLRFRSDENNQGKVCDVGLWHFSRHPNYFCEWIIWCSFGLFAFSNTQSLLCFISPLIMFMLLNFVSGVPIAEVQSLKSKGILYAEYQKRTSRFFPWFPKTLL